MSPFVANAMIAVASMPRSSRCVSSRDECVAALLMFYGWLQTIVLESRLRTSVIRLMSK